MAREAALLCHVLTPLTPPDAVNFSGDRTFARMLISALGRLGFDARPASGLVTRLEAGDAVEVAALQAAADGEVDRIARQAPGAALVFSYHVYYRSPDLVGPALSRRLGVPYVVAGGSRAPKRAHGRFAAGHRLASEALDGARLVFASYRKDREMLDRFRPKGQDIVDLRPFIDLAEWPAPPRRHTTGEQLRLITVGRMRTGRKAASYMAMAAALERIEDRPWSLDIVGDGDARDEVRARFAAFGPRVTFHGRIDDVRQVLALYARADLFVWPAVAEPYGMVFIEAQSQGLPCIAFADGGVADAVRDGVTGLLAPPGDVAALAAALDAAICRPDIIAQWRPAARDFIQRERSLDAALPVMARALRSLGLPAGQPRAPEGTGSA